MEKKIIGRFLAVAELLLFGGLTALVWSTPPQLAAAQSTFWFSTPRPRTPTPTPTQAGAGMTSVSRCGTLTGPGSFILTADLIGAPATACLTLNGSGHTIDLNGHSIRGDLSGAVGTGSTAILGSPGNSVTIKGPGIIHDFDTCLTLGTYALAEDVLIHGCWSGVGIMLGSGSKCVQCRVSDARVGGTPGGFGIIMGDGCLLESSIVEQSDNGANVGQDCKVWDLVVDTVAHEGLIVGAGTSVARSVISHFHDGPGLDYRACSVTLGCQDSSNSVWSAINASATPIADGPTPAAVITDCATNNSSTKYKPALPTGQCPP